VVGRKDANLVAAGAKAVNDAAAAFLVTADGVGRVEVGEDEDAHERGK
jgi:hypothetical protein